MVSASVNKMVKGSGLKTRGKKVESKIYIQNGTHKLGIESKRVQPFIYEPNM
jgi:hypothetical protein